MIIDLTAWKWFIWPR